jgi:uncharacterized SAM-binding protein YcdF (DUF218 family)
VAGVFLGSGQHLGEKVLKALATPLGVVWVLLFLLGYFSLLRRRTAVGILALLAWGILTLGGNQLFSRWVVSTLEKPYLNSQFAKLGPFETVLVLGGGTSVTPQGDPQLDSAGDRLMLVARLYRAGKVERILVSGSQFTRSSELDLDPGQESKLLLVQIGVPEERISIIEGLNTSEEMKSLRLWLDNNHPEGAPNLGILTSAWHLNRAMKLAAANKIKATAVPSNFHTQPFVPSPHLVIPSGEDLYWTSVALHEYLGQLVGR